MRYHCVPRGGKDALRSVCYERGNRRGENISMLLKAIEFATRAHTGQLRKASTEPYITHPLAVSRMLAEQGASRALIVAGMLHDTLEDTPVTLEEIRKHFGKEVAALVAAVSEPDKSAPWEQRKLHTLAVLETASQEVLMLTWADKLHNLTTIQQDYARLGEDVWERFSRPRAYQHWYYYSIAQLLARRAETEPLQRAVEEYLALVEAVFGAAPPELELQN